MEATEIVNMLENVKKLERKLKEVNIMKECKRRIFYITLETAAGAQVELEPSEVFSKNLLNFIVEELTKDYKKNIEDMKKLGINVTNVFEKEKIEKEISMLKNELEEL